MNYVLEMMGLSVTMMNLYKNKGRREAKGGGMRQSDAKKQNAAAIIAVTHQLVCIEQSVRGAPARQQLPQDRAEVEDVG